MPLVVIDARGLTLRPSGARTRLLGLLGAYTRLPHRFDVTVVATSGRNAREALDHLELDVVERSASRHSHLGAAVRVAGPPFNRADILHRETFPVPAWQPAPVALTVHDLRSTHRHGLASSTAKGVYERHVLPRVASRVSAVIAVSEATAADIRARLRIDPERITVVANAVEPVEAQRDAPRRLVEQDYVLAFGHIEPRKNLHSLLPAMERAVADGAPPTLVVAGRDLGGLAALRDAFERGSHSFRLRMLTDVDDDTRASLLTHARCLVMPSLVEGFGLVPLEALACGTPVIASSLPATHEVLADGAIFIDPADATAFGRAIADLSMDDGLAASLVERGRDAVGRYSWHRSATILHQTYERILAWHRSERWSR